MKNRSIISLNILFATICLLFVFSSYLYVYHRTTKMTDGAISLNGEMSRDRELRQEADTIADTYKKVSEYADNIKSSLVTESDIIKPIQEIESIGTQAGVTLTLAQVEVVRNKDNSSPYTIMKITAVGSWANVFSALKIMENIPYISRIEKLLIERQPNDKLKDWTLSAELHLAMDK